MSAVKLYYFNATGRAQHIRFALAAGGVAFEDVVPMAMPTPAEVKEKWASLTKGTTTFSVPIMTIGEGTDSERVYVQSSAVLRAAGRLGDLKMTLPGDDPETVAYLTDRAIADADDIRTAAYKAMVLFGKPQKDADNYVEKVFPKHVKALTAQLESFGPDAEYWGGSSTLSLADVTLYEAVQYFGRNLYVGAKGIEDPTGPTLKAWLDRVANDASLKAYVESEQYTKLAFRFTKKVIGR